MAEFDVKFMFPRTLPGRPKVEVIARVDQTHRQLSLQPLALPDGSQYKGWGGSLRPRPGMPTELMQQSYLLEDESRKSSRITVHNLFIDPHNSSLLPFQLLSKEKIRIPVRHVWEFLMLDIWSGMLRAYSKGSGMRLAAPLPFKLEGNSVTMSREIGTIGDWIHDVHSRDLRIPVPGQTLTLYQAFAFHLGALARIKEEEEITHGDYVLRHALFSPTSEVNPIFYIVDAWNRLAKKEPPQVAKFMVHSGVSIVDVEHSQREPRTKVVEENERLIAEARNYFSQRGNVPPAEFEAAYRNGYDTIQPLNALQGLVDTQQTRWGVSIDRLF